MKEQGRWTRRDVAAALGVGGLGAFVGGRYFDSGIPEQFHYVDEEQFRDGFFPIEQNHPIWKDLTTPETRIALGYKDAAVHGHSPFFQREYYFTVEDDTTSVEVELAATSTSNVAAKPFIATLENGTNFFLPFVQSVRPSSVTTLLGGLSKGNHALLLQEVPSNFPLGDNVLFPLRLRTVSGTPLQNYLRDTQPRYALRADNMADMTNDMPLFETSEILVNISGTEIISDKTNIYTSEDSGLSPVQRLKDYGRTVDMEPTIRQKSRMRRVIGYPGEGTFSLPFENQSYEAIVQVPGRKTPHGWAQFDGKRKNGHPILQIKTDNNLLSEEEETYFLFAPIPMYGLGENTANKLLRANPEWQIIGFEEEARAAIVRTLPQAGHLAELDLNALEHHPYGRYPTTDVLLAA